MHAHRAITWTTGTKGLSATSQAISSAALWSVHIVALESSRLSGLCSYPGLPGSHVDGTGELSLTGPMHRPH